ncbi:MAG: NAD-glutamate dehydrogenase [Rickettsia endosymbiont of Sergentomyia squamirostris]|uniref:NAD-glutamate dehydrogenase n=1 Tax=Candidatus Tisiphia endosymbiont of Sergentomyia squamirostris TaxID=3113639 RepID=A0AAT9G790_9RICK
MTTEKTSLALSKLTCQVPNYKSEILSLSTVKNGNPFYSTPLYSKFVQKFLAYIPVDYRFRDRLELFDEFTNKAFQFFQEKQPDKRKLQIVSTVIENDPAINILLLNDNKSFIVDSIICLLTSLNLKAKFLLHPIIACVRNNDGNLQEILDIKKDREESLVHITILGSFDQKDISSLEMTLNEVLDQVDTTYNVWSKILNRVTLISNDIQNNQQLYNENHLDYHESINFLDWLKDDNFTFLGMINFDLTSKNFSLEDGIKKIWQNSGEVLDIIERSANSLHENKLIILGKINILSKVHRSNLVDYILIKKIDQEKKYHSGSIIFGLYSSAMYYQLVTDIPILRQKLKFVVDKAAFPVGGYNTKKLKNIIQSLPKEALIQIDEGDLYCMCLHVFSGITSKKLKLFIQQDWSGSFINVIIFLPRDRLTLEVHSSINYYLSNILSGLILLDYTAEVVENFSYLFITLELQGKKNIDFDVELIEQELDKLSTRWNEDFYQKLCKEFGEYQGGVNFKLFDPIFPIDYREKFNGQTALIDIDYLKEASIYRKPIFNLIAINNKEFQLKIYSPTPKLALSDLLPSIENLGFKAIDEQSFTIKGAGDIEESWIYEFTLETLITIESNIDLLKANVEEALDKIYLGLLANDSLSKLIVLSGFNWWQVKLVKALTRYLHQTGFVYGKGYVQLTLIKHFLYTKMLVDLFDTKFNPANFSDERLKTIKDSIFNYLNTITSSSEDKVLRQMFDIIEAIVRTNCYQPSSNDLKNSANKHSTVSKNYFSFKFDSQKVPHLPLPVPFTEIFVYDNDFEAIHLRGGVVARGGIRWSDRGEDYRVEVLGLMKAQMTKNSVIVPVGSKGGFFINFTDDNMTRQDYMDKVVQCYKNFLRGLLDITDNIIDGKVIQPKNTVIYDQEDPYLVVAADKGTASFSDYANSVSAEYNFWLGDAFASGGSVGYDHKKMAITSKGAWISVASHFHAMGIDVQKDPITVVGIGDMSGDVFGNGMLRSNTIKLVAAFNHKHIFIDPQPDPIISFNERMRLFKLPTSNWSDYNQQLISKGGGVFERNSKSILLSTETKLLLKIDIDQLTPEQLIRTILQAEVDLLWNGGIGTYIKASTESHLEIGDKANDNLRVNGKDIRAKVIGEGGNIGVSQQGRIEYSKLGGRINTDFIDNSAGVDCSDHEVNIKIALNQAMSSNKISLEERNKFLFTMTKHVEELVLVDNYKQTQALDIMQLSSTSTIGVFSQFIDTLEEEKLINRTVEFLPTQEELSKRAVNKENMPRPELCVLLSYSKRSVYHDLITATFSKDKYFESYLINYFPKLIQEKFREEILAHPLKHEIIRTVVTNKIVNQLGGPSLNLIKRETQAALCDIVRSYTIICEIFDLDNLWAIVESLASNIDHKVKIDMFTELAKIMRRGISWFLKHIKHPINISNTIDEFYEPARMLSKVVGNLLLGEAKNKFDNKVKQYTLSGVTDEIARRIATLDSLVSVFDIIYIAKKTKAKNNDVANLYFTTGNKFSIDWLRKSCDKQLNDSYWNRLSIQSLKDDLYDKQRQLLAKIINNSKLNIDLDLWIDNNIDAACIFLDFVKGIRLQETIDLNILILANKKFETFLRKLE